MTARPNMQAMRAKLAETGQAQASKLDEAIASKPHEAMPPPASKAPSKPETAPAPAKVKKKSTSLYLSGAASRTLHMIAAQEGERPHKIVDDALRAEFAKYGHDFDKLNAMD